MELGPGLSEERRSRDRHPDRRIFQVEKIGREGLPRLLPLLWEAAYQVNHEDLDTWRESTLKSGEVFHVHGTEQRFFDLEAKQCEFRIATVGNNDAGLLVSQWMSDSIMYVRLLYVKPEHEGLGIGQGLVDAASPRALVFRTRLDIQPENLIRITSTRLRRVCRSENFNLWRMNWEN